MHSQHETLLQRMKMSNCVHKREINCGLCTAPVGRSCHKRQIVYTKFPAMRWEQTVCYDHTHLRLTWPHNT